MRKLLFFLLLSYALALPAHAQESPIQILDTTELEQALPAAAEEIYGELPVDASAWNDAAGKLLCWKLWQNQIILKIILSSNLTRT